MGRLKNSDRCHSQVRSSEYVRLDSKFENTMKKGANILLKMEFHDLRRNNCLEYS